MLFTFIKFSPTSCLHHPCAQRAGVLVSSIKHRLHGRTHGSSSPYYDEYSNMMVGSENFSHMLFVQNVVPYKVYLYIRYLRI